MGRGVKNDTEDLCLGNQVEDSVITQDRKCRRTRDLRLGEEQIMCLAFDVLRSRCWSKSDERSGRPLNIQRSACSRKEMCE